MVPRKIYRKRLINQSVVSASRHKSLLVSIVRGSVVQFVGRLPIGHLDPAGPGSTPRLCNPALLQIRRPAC